MINEVLIEEFEAFRQMLVRGVQLHGGPTGIPGLEILDRGGHHLVHREGLCGPVH